MGKVSEWVPALEVIRTYGVEGATELCKLGGMEWRGPSVKVRVSPNGLSFASYETRGLPGWRVVDCPGSEARCIPAEPSAPVAASPAVVHLPLPEPLETLLYELTTRTIGLSVEADVLVGRAAALVEASRQQRREIEQSLATMPITFGFSAAESSLTDAELAEMRRRTNAATPGPWEVELLGRTWRPNQPDEFERALLQGPNIRGYEGELWRREDGEFVAHARQDMVRLLDEIDRLRNPRAPPAPPVYAPPSTERPDGR